MKAELATAPTIAAAEAVLLRAAPGAEELIRADRELAALGHVEDDTLLDLPISIYGGG